MKAPGRERARVRWTDDEAKRSWAEAIPIELWDELFDKLNFSSEYPKGTVTAARHVTYSQHINKLAEMIRISKKSCFRTDSEIFRVAVHHGIGLMYNVFCNNNNETKKTRSHFFYAALKDLEKQMERATMISIINEKAAALSALIKNKSMTDEEAHEALEKIYATLPEDDKEYIVGFFKKPKVDNIRNIHDDLMKSFAESK